MLRNTNWLNLLIVTLAVVSGMGCGRQSQDPKAAPRSQAEAVLSKKKIEQFQWRTNHPTSLWVESASGFPNDPRCGVLGAGATEKGLSLRPQPFPLETTITWWKGERADRSTSEHVQTTVAIPPIPQDLSNPMLVFNFEDSRWSVQWERYPHGPN